jgi:predicted dinucleotide-binding enzyme
VVLATLGRAAEEAIALAGPGNFAGKNVIDTTNPIAATAPVGGILAFTTGPNESLGERIQSVLPESHVVKAFNSVGAVRMVNPEYRQGTPTVATTTKRNGRSPESFDSSAGNLTIAAGSLPRAPSNHCAFCGACAVSSTTSGTTRSNY